MERLWDDYWFHYSPSRAEKYLIRQRNNVILQLLARINRPKDQIKILEVGSGFASNSKILKRLGFSVFCLDISKTAIRRTKGEIAAAIIADARRLPFKKDVFDIVFSAGLLEHYKSPRQIVNEMLNVARGDGFVLNFVPGAFSLWQVYRGIRTIFGGWIHGYEESYTHHKLRDIYPSNCIGITSGGIDFLSLNGLLIKLFGIKLFPDIYIGKTSYTELYYAVSKPN